MKETSPRQVLGTFTHYTYLGGGDVPRTIVSVIDLAPYSAETRRDLINKLVTVDGECVARLPDYYRVDPDLDSLERFLEGEL